MTESRILVTGATGRVGGFLIERLEAEGQPFLAASSQKIDSSSSALGNWVRFDFTNPRTFDFGGFDRVFLMRPPAVSNIKRDMLPALKWFRSIGVRHVVVMSVLGAERAPWIPHRKLERAVQDLGFAYTFVRPSFFMQNLSGIHAEEIRTRDQVFVPAGDISMSFIDARDIAEACCRIFQREEQYVGRSFTLTGPDALSFEQVAELLSRALGRAITYTRPSLLRFVLRMRSRGLPMGYVLVMAALYVASRLRPPDRVTEDFQEIAGHPATPMASFIDRELETWR